MDPAELEAILRGDRRAVERFVQDYGPRLRATMLPILHDEQESEDLLQEVLSSLFVDGARRLRGWQRGRGRSLLNYLRELARLRALDRLRQRKRDPAMGRGGDDDLSGLPDDRQARDETPEWLEPVLQSFYAERAEEDRLLLELLYERDLTPREAAKELGKNENAVYQRLSRIRKWLRDKRAELLSGSADGARKPSREQSDQGSRATPELAGRREEQGCDGDSKPGGGT